MFTKFAFLHKLNSFYSTYFPKFFPHYSFLFKIFFICLLFIFIIFGINLTSIEPLPIHFSTPQFNAKNAHRWMTQLSKQFPGRVTWSHKRKEAGEWLKAELKKLGYTPKTLGFSEMIAGKQYVDLENIYIEKIGKKYPHEIIVIMAHYDITDTTHEGAMDDASGVGVVLELARVFAQEESERSLLFLLTDSEEFGAFWGARAFAQSFDKKDQIIAALNFDFVSPEKQTKILTLCDGLKQGFTPLWLRELALNSLRSLGSVEAVDMTGLMEMIERAMQIPAADHGAFLAAGIPAFNWVGQTDQFSHIMAHYHHTKEDVAEALEVDSFKSFGQGAERIIRSINELHKIPENFRNSSYWKVSSHYYLPGWAVTLIHIFIFIPFLFYSLIQLKRALQNHSQKEAFSVLMKEFKMMGILFGSFLLGYALLLSLPALRLITDYESSPATQKSVLLSNPNFIAIVSVILAICTVYWIFKKLFSTEQDSLNDPELRHSIHLISLAFIIFLAFLKNSYLGVLLLLPPAYFWSALRQKRETPHRIMNAFLLMSGTITFVAIIVLMTTVFHVGIFYWYLFLATAYGLISAYSVILFLMAFTIMIRLFKSFVFIKNK